MEEQSADQDGYESVQVPVGVADHIRALVEAYEDLEHRGDPKKAAVAQVSAEAFAGAFTKLLEVIGGVRTETELKSESWFDTDEKAATCASDQHQETSSVG